MQNSSPEHDVGHSCSHVWHGRVLDGTVSGRHKPSALRFLGAIACAVGLCGIISCIALDHGDNLSQVFQFLATSQQEATVSPQELVSSATESADRQPRSALFQMLAKLTTVYSMMWRVCMCLVPLFLDSALSLPHRSLRAQMDKRVLDPSRVPTDIRMLRFVQVRKPLGPTSSQPPFNSPP